MDNKIKKRNIRHSNDLIFSQDWSWIWKFDKITEHKKVLQSVSITINCKLNTIWKIQRDYTATQKNKISWKKRKIYLATKFLSSNQNSLYQVPQINTSFFLCYFSFLRNIDTVEELPYVFVLNMAFLASQAEEKGVSQSVNY